MKPNTGLTVGRRCISTFLKLLLLSQIVALKLAVDAFQLLLLSQILALQPLRVNITGSPMSIMGAHDGSKE